MLRNYKHAHLVEFIGTAMAVERGADTVSATIEKEERKKANTSCTTSCYTAVPQLVVRRACL